MESKSLETGLFFPVKVKTFCLVPSNFETDLSTYLVTIPYYKFCAFFVLQPLVGVFYEQPELGFNLYSLCLLLGKIGLER